MSDLESHWLAERLAYLGRSLLRDMVWRQKVRYVFPRLVSDPKPKATVSLKVLHCLPTSAKRPSRSKGPRSRKELYRELVVGTASDPLV